MLLETDRLSALNVVGRNVLLLLLDGQTTEPFVAPGGGVIPGIYFRDLDGNVAELITPGFRATS